MQILTLKEENSFKWIDRENQKNELSLEFLGCFRKCIIKITHVVKNHFDFDSYIREMNLDSAFFGLNL